MRKKLRRRLEKEFIEQVEKSLPGFLECEGMAIWKPALRLSVRNDMHFFLALDPFDDRDCFDITFGMSKYRNFPDCVDTMGPADPPDQDSLQFPVGALWQDGVSPYWCLVKEPDLFDPIENWSKPNPSQESILPKIPAIVRECIDALKQPVLDFIAMHSKTGA